VLANPIQPELVGHPSVRSRLDRVTAGDEIARPITNAGTATAMPDKRLVVDLVAFEYRSMVLQQLQVSVEWQQTEWFDSAVCQRTARPAIRPASLVRYGPNALPPPALAVDDPAEWRGAVSLAEQEELSERLETAFNRDRDFMQLDSTGWLMVARNRPNCLPPTPKTLEGPTGRTGEPSSTRQSTHHGGHTDSPSGYWRGITVSTRTRWVRNSAMKSLRKPAVVSS
jgi:hypothetical protein